MEPGGKSKEYGWIEESLVWWGQRGWGCSPLSPISDVACHDLEPTGEKSAQRWRGGSTELPLADQTPEPPEPPGLSLGFRGVQRRTHNYWLHAGVCARCHFPGVFDGRAWRGRG